MSTKELSQKLQTKAEQSNINIETIPTPAKVETGLSSEQQKPKKHPRKERLDGIEAELLRLKKDILRLGINEFECDRMIRVLVNDLDSNDNLLQCHPMSIIAAFLKAAQLGLEPNSPLGECHIVPRYNNTVAVFQIGYQGYIKLFRNSPDSSTLLPTKVYDNDLLEIEKGTNPKVYHKVGKLGERRKIIGYYVIAKLKNGDMNIIEANVHEIEELVNENPDRFKSEAWKRKSDFHPMAMKTIINECLNYMPTEIRKLVTLDNSVSFYNPNQNRNTIIDMTEYPNKLYEIEAQQQKQLPIPEKRGQNGQQN